MAAEPGLFTPPPRGDAPRAYLTPRRVVFGPGTPPSRRGLSPPPTGPRPSWSPTRRGAPPAPAARRESRLPWRRPACGSPATTYPLIPTSTRSMWRRRPAGPRARPWWSGSAAAGLSMPPRPWPCWRSNPGTAEEYQMGRAVEVDPLPFIAVPTTVGTGSEATMVAVLRNRRAGVVKAIREPRMIPPVAVLDPLLLAGLPPRLLRLGGLRRPGPRDRVLPVPGGHRLHPGPLLRGSAPGGRRPCARWRPGNRTPPPAPALLLGSYFAGVALQAGPGLAHVLAQPITAVTGIPHSAAIAALLPLTVAFNEARRPGDDAYRSPRPPPRTARARAAWPAPSGACSPRRGPPSACRASGPPRTRLPRSWTWCGAPAGHIGGNPVPLDMGLVGAVLAEALGAPPYGLSPAGGRPGAPTWPGPPSSGGCTPRRCTRGAAPGTCGGVNSRQRR